MQDIAHLLAPGPARPLLDIVQPVVEDAGFHLVRIRITGEGTKMILQIMADDNEGELRIDDLPCWMWKAR
jgi:ribosome maturation factor RimP